MTRAAAIAGLAGLLVAASGWLLDDGAFYGGWLAALALVAGWPLGSMAILMVHALTGGRWGETLAPALRLGVCALPLLVPAALPLMPGLAPLYPWARADAARHFANLFYLNVPFFSARMIAYLLVWLVLGWLVLRARAPARIAPAGLFVLAITTSFAAIDTTMSLDPQFSSTIYGMVAAAGMGLLALSVAVLLSATAPGEDFGKLLLALGVLWIYLDFIQLLIVWQSNLVNEAPWYLARARGGWAAAWLAVAAGHFAVPFCLLLSPRMQRSRRVVMCVAGLLVASQIVRGWWTVLPSLGRGVDWIAVACMVGLGGSALATACWIDRHVSMRRVAHV